MQIMNGFSGSMIVLCAFNFYLHSFTLSFVLCLGLGFD